MNLKWFILDTSWSKITCGWGNGYVALPKKHPLYGVDYEELSEFGIYAHGGITYSECAKYLKHVPDDIQDDDWLVGFDTCHAGDTLDNWDMKHVRAETLGLKKDLESITREDVLVRRVTAQLRQVAEILDDIQDEIKSFNQ